MRKLPFNPRKLSAPSIVVEEVNRDHSDPILQVGYDLSNSMLQAEFEGTIIGMLCDYNFTASEITAFMDRLDKEINIPEFSSSDLERYTEDQIWALGLGARYTPNRDGVLEHVESLMNTGVTKAELFNKLIELTRSNGVSPPSPPRP